MRFLMILFACLSAANFQVSAQVASMDASDPTYEGRLIAKLLDQSESELDYAELTLKFNLMVDPDFSASKIADQLNIMAEQVQRLAGDNPDDVQLLTALRQYLYDPGPWNDQKIFGYDHSDPLGTHIPNKLMHTYLKRRLGNCVSMPTLFLILGEKLGLNLTLSTAPNHVFIHYHLPDGRVMNIEATSGGYPTQTENYIESFNVSKKAIQTGLYLKVLSRKQTAAILAGLVLEDRYAKGQFGYAIHIADALIAIYPEYAAALITRGMSYQSMIAMNFGDDFSNPRITGQNDVAFYNYLALNAEQDFEKVDSLGYTEPPKP